MTKEYLKMADVFLFDVAFDSYGGIGAVVDTQGEYISQAMENNSYCSHMSNKDKNEYRNKIARYIAHAIASHDELVAENERMRESNKRMAKAIWSKWEHEGIFTHNSESQADIFRELYLCDPSSGSEAE